MLVYSIPGKLEVNWNEDVKAIVDKWTTYSIPLAEFKEAVLVQGLNFAKAHNGVAWIVDSSSAKGAFTQEIQNFIGTDIFPAFANNGIKYFFTITANASPITKMTVSTYAAKIGPSGILLVEANSVDEAIMWLKEHNK